MTKKFTAAHQGGPSRVFVSQDAPGNHICSVLYKKSVTGTFSDGDKITEYDIKHFLASNEADAINAAKSWIEQQYGNISSFTQDP
jgi:hypothetical protein